MKKLMVVSLFINLIGLTFALFIVYRAGGFKYLLYKFRNAGKNHAYQERMSIFRELPSVKDKIVFLGNSITAGGEWSELLDRKDVANRGIGGDVVNGVLDRLEPILNEEPAQVFLMIGINDLLQGKDQKMILQSYRKILEKFQRYPEIKLFVQSVLPVNSNVVYDKRLENSEIKAFNEELKQLCQELNVSFIDLYPSFVNPETGMLHDNYTTDGLHLSGKGYLVWKKQLEPYL